MAIKRLGQSDNKDKETMTDSEDMKPLVKEFGKHNPKIYTEVHVVISGRMSKSCQWCILETEEYVVLMRASSKPVVELFEQILPKLNGKNAKALVIEPSKKTKCGANVAVDDEQKFWYSYDSEDKSFTQSESEVKETKKQGGLSLDMFID